MLPVNTNVVSLGVANTLATQRRDLSKSMGHISSGLRINQAADDAAGLAVAENLDTRERSQRQAQRNIKDGMSLIQVADDAYSQIGSLFMRMRELAVQSSSETYTDKDRAHMQEEYLSLFKDGEKIRDGTQFAGQDLMSYAGGFDHAPHVFSVQAGVDNSSHDTIDITVQQPLNIFTMGWIFPGEVGYTPDLTAHANAGVDTVDKARGTIGVMDDMILWTNYSRTQIGTAHNRLEHAMNHLSSSNENMASAQSRIRDADMAYETAQLTKSQILTQASTAVLGQANSLPETALNLL